MGTTWRKLLRVRANDLRKKKNGQPRGCATVKNLTIASGEPEMSQKLNKMNYCIGIVNQCITKRDAKAQCKSFSAPVSAAANCFEHKTPRNLQKVSPFGPWVVAPEGPLATQLRIEHVEASSAPSRGQADRSDRRLSSMSDPGVGSLWRSRHEFTQEDSFRSSPRRVWGRRRVARVAFTTKCGEARTT